MFNTVKQSAVSTTKFVKKHRVAIAVAVTFTVTTALQSHARTQLNDFLAEKGLLEEFYTPENSY